jgi:hypothetical protein
MTQNVKKKKFEGGTLTIRTANTSTEADTSTQAARNNGLKKLVAREEGVVMHRAPNFTHAAKSSRTHFKYFRILKRDARVEDLQPFYDGEITDEVLGRLKTRAWCSLCNTLVGYSQSTTNLMNHLTSKHNGVMDKLRLAQAEAQQPKKNDKCQGDLSSFVAKGKARTLSAKWIDLNKDIIWLMTS